MNQRLWLPAGVLVVLALASTRCGSSKGGGTPGQSSSSSGGSSGGGGSGSTSSGGGSSGSASGSGGGSSGSGSSSGGDAGDSGAVATQSVLQRGNDVYRRATFEEPGLTEAAVPAMAPDTTFNKNATFSANGNTQNQGTASVLYLEQGPAAAGCPTTATGCQATTRPAGNGIFLAFPALGSTPNVVAFDETTGLPVWTADVTPGSDGIRGTAVIDPEARRLYVVTGHLTPQGSNTAEHLVHSLSVDDGTEVTTGGWPVALSTATVTYNGTGFNSSDQNQHGASLLLNGILYIPFGGQYGDGGTYLGWIVAVNTTNPTQIGGWATGSKRSGIWGAGGLASDGTSVFGATGDTDLPGGGTTWPRTPTGSSTPYDSEEVVRVTALAQFTRSEANVFYPTEWESWDKPNADLDFGASTPAYTPLPSGSNPSGLLIAPAKPGHLFILNAADLSTGSYPNAGGQLQDLTVAATNAESVYTAPTIYTSASGLHATINVGDAPAGCPAGTPNSNGMIISVLLTPGQTPIATEKWCTPSSGNGHMNYPPISTTTDGVSANAMVWFINNNQLEAIDGDTGKVIVTTTGATCDTVPSMSFPVAVKNRIVVSALGHLCSWSLNGQ